MAKAKTQKVGKVGDEISIFIREDELNAKTAKAIYEFAKTNGYRLAIKLAQRVAGADENGVMSNEALKAINALKEDDFIKAFELEIQGY
ncbi:hypothetical protein [Campylobacter mucosalis]|uniref:Uncharacterized protein n=1 Tax=Campylobacter mucosalis CCUG 21559 TaxID=1032067 RepID=A0A6G5QGC4_9BACT|nr:hypothetical protein [Campylobacter mucosalis]QCD44112.1 hypothetical protein CMUC_0298 [Campylobacter mucosalis CCUG 21559]QCD44701.1 hypothetical protein CMUC_0912 [Campylobacter mucosalis CCUG 21559]